MTGQRGVFSALMRVLTRPRPPMQMRAISTPASRLPGASTPASAITVPASVREMAMRRLAASSTSCVTSRSLSAFTLRSGACAISEVSAGEGDDVMAALVAGVKALQKARVLQFQRVADGVDGARDNDQRAHRLSRLDARAGLRHVAADGVCKAGIAECGRYGERVRGEQDALAGAKRGAWRAFTRQPAMQTGIDVAGEQSTRPHVGPDCFVKRHRGRRTRIDFQYPNVIAVEQEIDAVDPRQPRARDDRANRRA